MRINYWVQPVTYIDQQQQSRAKVIFLNKFINKNSQLSQQTKPLAMYHTKIFDACKYSRVEDPINREGESSLTQMRFDLNIKPRSIRVCFKIHALSNSRNASCSRLLSLSIEIAVSCSNAPFIFSQSNLESTAAAKLM